MYELSITILVVAILFLLSRISQHNKWIETQKAIRRVRGL